MTLTECITLADVKAWFRRKLWNWLGCQREVNYRVAVMQDRLAADHAAAVRHEKEQLRNIIRELIRVKVMRMHDMNYMQYTTTISDMALLRNVNDREYLMKVIAEEAAYKLMHTQPIRYEHN